VPIAPDVLKEILRFQPLCTDGYLVPGANRTERHEAVYRRHSKWVARWIKDRTKTSYELRRYAGSRLLDMGATVFEVRDFLRHRDVQTTQMWYAYRLQNRQLPTIGMRDLVPN
jgi:integrase